MKNENQLREELFLKNVPENRLYDENYVPK